MVMGVIGVVTLVIIVFVCQKNLEQFQNPHPETTWLKNGPDDNNKFDINAPPIPFKANDPDYASRTRKNKAARKKHGKRNKSKFHFPVIDADDDSLPQAAASGSKFHAADTLMCGATVIDYVINATDLKDECEGLRKAFTKTCTNEKEESSSESKKNSRRRSLEDQNHPRYSRRKPSNPLIAWQHFLYRLMHGLWHWLEPKKAVFMSEEEVVEEFEFAKFEVAQGWDIEVSDDDDALRRSHRRFLEERMEEEVKPTVYLELPTTHKHVSEKTWSETLVLQNEENMIESVMKAQQNQTNTNVTVNEATANAAESSKAVADTAAFVANVLNDPTSVEARACCTSILNVFHENCSVDVEEELSDIRLFIVVAVIGLCGLVKSLIRHFHIRWLPEAAGCIMVGGKYKIVFTGTGMLMTSCA
jgi:hypothetical protein